MTGMQITRTILFALSLSGSCLLLNGCATELALQSAHESFAQEKLEESLSVLSAALEQSPTNPALRESYLVLRDRGIAKILETADVAKREGDFSLATRNYRRILSIDPESTRAKNGLAEVEREIHNREILSQVKDDIAANEIATSAQKLRLILSGTLANPEAKSLLKQLEEKTTKPSGASKIEKAMGKTLSIDFKDAMLKQVFEVFSRTTSVNFVFDKDVRGDQKVTVFLKDTSVKEALDVVLFTNQLEQRTLDRNTILIYPSTPAKLKDYQPLTVRGFFLANAEPEPVANALKSLLKMKDVIVDKRQNLITVRDTPDAILLAEKLIALHDLPEPEVMLEVEILEVNRNRLMELGIKYPSQLTLTPLTAVSGDTLTLNDLRNISSSKLGAQISPLVINARRETADIQLLANPRIRVRNRDTAKILIGDKVPNITTTATATGFVSSNVQYLDVGLKLEVVPTITVDNEVAIKISLEVSNIANQVTTPDKTVAYQIGTRSASTVLRLKDGENQVLAGLINDNDRHSASRIPGLGDLPLLGRLFSSHLQEGNKSEIVLSITPRLVRNNLRPDLSISEFESGTETGMRGLSGTGNAIGSISPADKQDNVAASSRKLSLPPASTAPGTPPTSVEPAAPTVQFEAPNQVKAGTTFSLKVNISSARPLTGVPLAIGFDPGKFEVLNVQEGSFLAQAGGSSSFSQRIDKAAGQVLITGTRTSKGGSDPGATGMGSLATLTMKATESPGTSDFRFVTVAPIAPNGANVPANVPPAFSISITP